MTDVYCYAESVPLTDSWAFHYENLENRTLHVPASALDDYKTTAPWSGFGRIVGLSGSVSIGEKGMATYCPTEDVDFKDVDGVKAYIASVFNRQTGVLTLTRVFDVPAGTGLLLKGEPGTYEVPYRHSYSVASNLLKGVSEATDVSATEGNFENYVLSDGSQGVGFYKVGSAGASLEADRAYLQIPAETAAGSRSSLKLRFDDEEEATRIADSRLTTDGAVYDLQGRRVSEPKKGIYIRDGRKVVIK